MLGARLLPMFEKDAKDRQLAGLKKGDETPEPVVPNLGRRETGRSVEKAAVAVNVSRGTVEAASKVLKHGIPELVEAVERGQVAVSAAAAVASLPAEEQREAVAGGKEAVRSAPSPPPRQVPARPV